MSRTAKIAILVAVFAFGACSLACVLATLAAFRYQPAVVAARGYDMAWPTRPGPAGSLVKSYQMFFEMRPCEYELLGWTEGGQLYYRESCRKRDSQVSQVWAYDPDRRGRPRPAGVPPNLSQQVVPRESLLEWVRSPRVWPADAELNVRRLEVRVDGLASPDGQWVAAVVRHIYGPEDVIVVGE